MRACKKPARGMCSRSISRSATASPFISFNAEIVNESKLPGASGSRLLTRIGGHRTVTYLSRTYLTQRGRFALGPTTDCQR